jgi:hypothetical protein
MSADAQDKPQKVSIGFAGGQTLAARVRPSELAKLREALSGLGAVPAAGWYELAAEDGTITLGLARVDYVLVDHEEHRVGF